MKDKKIIIFVIFILIIGFIFIYISRPVHKPKPVYSGQAGPAGLTAQIEQLRGIVHGLVQSESVLKKQLDVQKQKFTDLEKSFMDATNRNEVINKELSLARVGLELAKPVKQRLSQVEDKLANFNFGAGKEKQIIKQLQDLNKSLAEVDNQIPSLVSEDKIYRVKAKEVETELFALKKDMGQERIKRENLSRDLNAMNIELKMANKARFLAGERAEGLEKEITELKNNNSYLNEEMKKSEKSLKEMARREAELIRDKEGLTKNRQRLENQVNQQYQAISPLKDKNKEMAEELNSLKQELDQLNRERQVMLKAMDEAKNATLNYQKLKQEISRLQTQLEEVNISYVSLKEDNKKNQELIKQDSLELGKRADRILVLQEKAADIENKLISLQLRYQEVEKDSASLRQDNVAIQLEREGMELELNRTKEKLGELDNKLQQISGVFGSGLKPAETVIKKVDVKLVPEVGPQEPEKK
jgi:chromosome segregation ATPase